jgi:hypothetical protein
VAAMSEEIARRSTEAEIAIALLRGDVLEKLLARDKRNLSRRRIDLMAQTLSIEEAYDWLDERYPPIDVKIAKFSVLPTILIVVLAILAIITGAIAVLSVYYRMAKCQIKLFEAIFVDSPSCLPVQFDFLSVFASFA